jgi:hypothetical protein
MKPAGNILALGFLCLTVACSSGIQATPTPVFTPFHLSTSTTPSTPSSSPTPLPAGARILSDLPKCEGIEIAASSVTFDWPNIEQRFRELADSDWYYFSCPQPSDVVSSFYRENATQPPYLLSETNWIDRPEGSLGIYFHSVKRFTLYLWIVPQSTNHQATYLIAAFTEGELIFEEECYLEGPHRQIPNLNHC